MNERIKQITGQVLDELVPETWVALGYDKIKEIQFRTAELIVRECAKIILETPVKYTEIDIMHIIRDTVKEHFGIEE